MKRSAFGTARRLTLAGRSQSLRIKRNSEPFRPHLSDSKNTGSGNIATVPFYLPSSSGKTSRSASNTTPLFNTSLLELKEPLEIDIPVGPDELSSALESHRLLSSQDLDSRGKYIYINAHHLRRYRDSKSCFTINV